jgi:hypothetical protein
LRIPTQRKGSYFPSLLEPRRRAEQALLAVVQQAYVQGVRTRTVDELLQALGLAGVDKSAVARMCRELDTVVEQFRQRPLEAAYPSVWRDARYLMVRQHHRIISQAVVIAVGVRATGEREVLGFAVGAVPGRRPSGRSSCAASWGAACTASNWWSATRTRGAKGPLWGGLAGDDLAALQSPHHPNTIHKGGGSAPESARISGEALSAVTSVGVRGITWRISSVSSPTTMRSMSSCKMACFSAHVTACSRLRTRAQKALRSLSTA